MRFMAALFTKMLTDNMLLSVFFLTGALAACPDDSHLFITAPLEIKALSGSCLQIPCNFGAAPGQTFDGSRTTFGVWIKNDHRFKSYPRNVIFNSSQTVNTYPMNVTGNLSQKNCTTLFSSLNTTYTDKYYFRIENGPFKETAVCDPVQITVKDSPPSPRIEISGELKEKESVTITCSAFTPCPHSPPKLTWNLQQDAHNKIEENADRTFTTKIQTTITLSDKHDGYNITCSSSYSVNEGQNAKSAEEKVTLSVSYAPKDTSARISPPGSVSPCSWVNLTCSSRAKPAANFTWFNISKDGPMKVSEGDFYSFNVTDGGVYHCVATNDLGNQTSEIHLTIKGPDSHGSFQRWAVLGGIIGIIVLICLVVCVCILVYLKCFRSTNPTPQQTQSQTGEEPASKTEEEKEKEGREDIHYREIDFSRLEPEPSCDSVQDIRQQQDTMYAQVKASEPSNRLTQTADGPKVLYAQMKKN
ncbi:myeloid cell surface antigen CD33-like [Thunnus albacares]|uniref:myeloid cell surface antigen CD33-like n=1 Tax=Thunnus albacares TaxID=8236 RepID=UPI001CF6E5FF|nr:myeloid cell surface antigen CD33-like [Thunnus albacares]